MGEAMVDDRSHPGIADQNLGKVLGCGITDERGTQIADQKTAHLG
jgi:hypothetical protein